MKTSIVVDGSFNVLPEQWRGRANHCGIDVSTVRFKVEVTGTLDARGFVVDVRDPHTYFADRFVRDRTPLDSCESIALAAARWVASIAEQPTGVKVEVQASRYGFAVVELDAVECAAVPRAVRPLYSV